jgi:hypothetical protein
LWLAVLLLQGVAFPNSVFSQTDVGVPRAEEEGRGRSAELALRERAEILAPLQEGFFVTPSFAVSELYTDNVTASPDHRLHDWVTRFSPGLEASYQSAGFTATAGYRFDAEVFARHSEFSSAMARQRGFLDFRYLPAPPLELSLLGEYTETRSPGEFNDLTGFPLRRTQAHRFLVGPSAVYRFNPRTTGRLDYTFSQEERRAGVTTDTHIGVAGIEREITGRDTVGLYYTGTRYLFRGTEIFLITRGAEVLDSITTFEGRDSTVVHSVQPSWTRDLTPLTSFAVRAGPRFSEGSVKPQISASIRRQLRRGEIILSYDRSHTTVVGESGIVDVNAVGLTVRYNVLPTLELRLAPAYFHNKRGGVKSDVYRARFDATYDVNRWLSIVGTYLFNYQQGLFLPPVVLAEADPADLALAGIRPNADVTRNVVGLSLVARFSAKLN